MHNKDKVFGVPLQNLYRSLLQAPHAPRQPELLRALTQALVGQGLHYHSRTLKRQLLGSIEYIPASLESSLVEWLQAHPISGQKTLLETFAREKAALEKSSDNSLYVPPHFLKQMADAYLFRHKGTSRRQLALQLGSSLKTKNLSLGLETLQAALAGKTQKVRKLIEEELLNYFIAEGFKNRAELETYLQADEATGQGEVQKVEVGDLSEWIDAYLLKHPGLSKRQLALRLRLRLEEKGYVYHLSSVQSVLEGKTRKTRRVIVDSLKEMLQADGLNAAEQISDFVQTMEAGQREWNHYVSAEAVPEWTRQLLEAHPDLTRRRIALQLREDSQKKGFNFSLSTLQYLLAGKTHRIKKVIAELLEAYLQPETAPDFADTIGRGHGSHPGRQSLQKQVEESCARYLQASGPEKEALRRAFFRARWELIRRLNLHKRKAEASAKVRLTRKQRGFEEAENPDSFLEGGGDSGEIPVAYNVRESLDRLVS